jgi:hypothetical protein
LRDGLDVAVPARDRGIVLIAYSDLLSNVKKFVARPIQMKASSEASFSIDRKYKRVANLIIAYVWHVHDPNPTVTYALTKTTPKDREARFWKQRLQTGDRAMEKLAEFMEKGTIAGQFDVHMVGAGRDLEVRLGEENSLLYRDGKWWAGYYLRQGRCDTCLEPQSQCQCVVADHSKPIYETRREGSFVAGYQTKPKFPEPEPGSMEEVVQQNAAKAKSAIAGDIVALLNRFGAEEA